MGRLGAGRTARHVLDGDRVDRLAVVTTPGCSSWLASGEARRSRYCDPVLHVQIFPSVRFTSPTVTGLTVDREGAHHFALTGMAITMVGPPRISDLVLEQRRSANSRWSRIGSFQAVQHKAADMQRGD